MNPDELKKLVHELINRQKWTDLLQHFVDVLKVNIFIVDFSGKIVLPPVKGRYGSDLLSRLISLENPDDPAQFIKNFQKQDTYLECTLPCELKCFGIPISGKEETLIAYLIVGPVILNKRLEKEEYGEYAKRLNLNLNDLFDALNEIKIVSHAMIKSILDLLTEVLKYGIQLNLQRQELEKMRIDKDVMTAEISEAAQDIYSSIYFDELLVTLLDVALSMTRAECGSIMIIDNEKGDLTIKVSRGIDKNQAQNARLQIGEGLAGLAVKEKQPLIISSQKDNNRIKHLLKRPEIKYALIMPLMAQNNVFGVLNLHTKKDDNIISDAESLDIVSHLSRLTATALLNIQQKNYFTPSK